MRKTLETKLQESLRLLILQLVGAVERRSLDENTLRSALRDMEHETLRAVLVGELRLLERQGLLDLEELPNGVLLASITERGDLCRRGVIEEPGVARPALR